MNSTLGKEILNSVDTALAPTLGPQDGLDWKLVVGLCCFVVGFILLQVCHHIMIIESDIQTDKLARKKWDILEEMKQCTYAWSIGGAPPPAEDFDPDAPYRLSQVLESHTHRIGDPVGAAGLKVLRDNNVLHYAIEAQKIGKRRYRLEDVRDLASDRRASTIWANNSSLPVNQRDGEEPIMIPMVQGEPIPNEVKDFLYEAPARNDFYKNLWDEILNGDFVAIKAVVKTWCDLREDDLLILRDEQRAQLMWFETLQRNLRQSIKLQYYIGINLALLAAVYKGLIFSWLVFFLIFHAGYPLFTAIVNSLCDGIALDAIDDALHDFLFRVRCGVTRRDQIKTFVAQRVQEYNLPAIRTPSVNMGTMAGLRSAVVKSEYSILFQVTRGELLLRTLPDRLEELREKLGISTLEGYVGVQDASGCKYTIAQIHQDPYGQNIKMFPVGVVLCASAVQLLPTQSIYYDFNSGVLRICLLFFGQLVLFLLYLDTVIGRCYNVAGVHVASAWDLLWPTTSVMLTGNDASSDTAINYAYWLIAVIFLQIANMSMSSEASQAGAVWQPQFWTPLLKRKSIVFPPPPMSQPSDEWTVQRQAPELADSFDKKLHSLSRCRICIHFLMSYIIKEIIRDAIIFTTPLLLMTAETALDLVKDAFAVTFLLALDDVIQGPVPMPFVWLPIDFTGKPEDADEAAGEADEEDESDVGEEEESSLIA